MDKYVTKTREGVEQARYRYSDADIEKANNVSIIDWVSQQGYPIKDERRWAEIKGQAGLTIDKINNRWYCHSQKIGGGPIQLLMFLQDLSWSEVVVNLIGEKADYQVINNRSVIPDQSKC